MNIKTTEQIYGMYNDEDMAIMEGYSKDFTKWVSLDSLKELIKEHIDNWNKEKYFYTDNYYNVEELIGKKILEELEKEFLS